ncbi:NUDIX hydrolase [bacterium]|nr:NUDIX hydrolase [bacterium]
MRVGVIIVHEKKVLLARQHVSEGQDFWIVPGGGLKKDEGLLDCARREIAEETGLEIEPVQLLYVGDFFKGGKHVVDMFWLGEVVGGELRRCVEELDSLQFFEIERLGRLDMRPSAIAERLESDLREGFERGAVYLGKYFRDPGETRYASGNPKARESKAGG